MLNFWYKLDVKAKVIGIVTIIVGVLVASILLIGDNNPDKELGKAVDEQKTEQKKAKKASDKVGMLTKDDLLEEAEEFKKKDDTSIYSALNRLIDSKSGKEKEKYKAIIENNVFYQDGMTEDQTDIMARKYRSLVLHEGYAGITYRSVKGSFVGDAVEENDLGVTAYSPEGYMAQPTEDGFKDMGDGVHVGYPMAIPYSNDGKDSLVLYFLVYFDDDMEFKDLLDTKFDVTFNGSKTEDASNYLGLPKDLGGYNNSFNSDFLSTYIEDSLGKEFETEDSVNYTEIKNNKLLSGGVIAYSVVYPVSNGLDSYADGDFKVTVNGEEFPTVSRSSLVDKAFEDSDYFDQAKYSIKVYK